MILKAILLFLFLEIMLTSWILVIVINTDNRVDTIQLVLKTILKDKIREALDDKNCTCDKS